MAEQARTPGGTRWYYGWNIIGVGMAFQAITFGLIFFSFTFWAAVWTEEFGASRRDIMTATLMTTVVIGAIMPFAGRAFDTVSNRALICFGTLCFAAGFALIALTTALWQIILIYGVLLALSGALAGPLAAQALAARWFRARRGTAIGLSSIGTSIGGVVMPLLVVFLFGAVGWRTSNVILAVLALVVVIPLVWRIVANTPEDKGIEPEPEAPLRGGAPPMVFPEWTTAMILRQRSFWVPILAFWPSMTAFTSMQFNLAPFLADRGFDLQDASLLMSLLAATMIGGKIFFGTMADRKDHKRLYWMATGTMLVGMGLLWAGMTFPVLVLASMVLGFAAGGFLPLFGAIYADHFGAKAFGRVSGLAGPFLTTSAVGPVLTGWIRDVYGSYDMALALWSVLIVPAMLVMMLLRKPGAAVAAE